MGAPLFFHVLRDHVALGGFVAFSTRPWLGDGGALIFWLSTIFIDLDHHVDFVWKTGISNLFNVRRMLAYHREVFAEGPQKGVVSLNLLHTLEALGLVYAAARIWPSNILRSVFWGFAFHFATDVVHVIRCRRPFVRAFSLVEYLLRKRLRPVQQRCC